MPQFSLIVRAKHLVAANVQRLVASLEAQTNPDWELVFVVGQFQHTDRMMLADICAGYPRARLETFPEGRSVYDCANTLLPDLGDWVGFIGQNDWLLPTALAEVAGGIAANSQARVVYTDEECENLWQHVSLRFNKGAIDTARLRAQEYLRDLTVIRRDWLTQLRGFDPMASDRPQHDIYLKTSEQHGAAGFLNVPRRLYKRHRNYTVNDENPRRQRHMIDYDLEALKTHFARCGIPASVIHQNGTAIVETGYQVFPSVTCVTLLDDDMVAGLDRVQALAKTTPIYRPLTVQLLYLGYAPVAIRFYEGLAKSLGYAFSYTTAGKVTALNQVLQKADTALAVILEGKPLNPKWLHRLVNQTQLGADVAGSRIITPKRLTQPGTLGYKYEGWDWNSRGRFNLLTVPHQCTAVSPKAMILRPEQFIRLGLFNVEYPTLFAHDYTLRVDADGGQIVQVPRSQVEHVEEGIPTLESERFALAYQGYRDRFSLHSFGA